MCSAPEAATGRNTSLMMRVCKLATSGRQRITYTAFTSTCIRSPQFCSYTHYWSRHHVFVAFIAAVAPQIEPAPHPPPPQRKLLLLLSVPLLQVTAQRLLPLLQLASVQVRVCTPTAPITTLQRGGGAGLSRRRSRESTGRDQKEEEVEEAEDFDEDSELNDDHRASAVQQSVSRARHGRQLRQWLKFRL